MWNQISPDLMEHIDGLFSKCDKPKALIKKEKEQEEEKKKRKNSKKDE